MRSSITAATVALALLIPGVARAQDASGTDTASTATTTTTAKAWHVGIAPRVGLNIATSKLGLFVVPGISVDFALPVASHRLVIAADAYWTQPSYDGTVMDPRIGGSGTYTIKESELTLGLDALFRLFPPGHSVVPYIGAGPVLHLLKTTETNSFSPGKNTAQSTNFGGEAVGGVDFHLGPGFLLGEVRYVYSNLKHIFTGDTNAGNIMISAGYRVVF